MGFSATQVNILLFAFSIPLYYVTRKGPPYNWFECLILAIALVFVLDPWEFRRWLMEGKDDRTQNYGWYSWKRKILLH